MSLMPKRPIEPADLWNIPTVGAPCPSPDGTRLIVPVTRHDLEENKGTTRLWLLQSGRRARAITADGVSSSNPVWSPDGTRLLLVRADENKKAQIHLLRLDGGDAEKLTDCEHGTADPRWFPDGKRIAYLIRRQVVKQPETKAKFFASDERVPRFWDTWLTDGKRWHLFVHDLDSGDAFNLTPRMKSHFGLMDPAGAYDIAPDGKEIAFSCIRTRPKQMVRMGLFTVPVKRKPPSPRPIPLDEDYDGYSPRFTRNGKSIVCFVRRDVKSWASRSRIARIDRRTGKLHEIAPRWTLDPSDFKLGPRGEIYALAETEGRVTLFRMGAKPKPLRRGGSFAGLAIAGQRLWMRRSSLKAPWEIESCDVDGSDVRRETTFTARPMRELAVGRVEDVTFRGARGDKVQMYIVHPPAGAPKRGRKRPLLHLIHGGPHGSFGDVWHPRWNTQAFAAQGYLCASVNFHGSTGWGEKFAKSIVGEWGDMPYDDIMLATDWLIEKRDVDPKRMAASGGSYGGYMASWIASQTRRFRCIVNHAGVCDLQAQYACEIPDGWSRCAGGDLWSGDEAQAGLDRYNPLRHVGGMKTPMLILHGEKDYRVPYTQGIQLYNILQQRNVPSRIVVYPEENHWILKPANSVHWYGEFLAWLSRWLAR